MAAAQDRLAADLRLAELFAERRRLNGEARRSLLAQILAAAERPEPALDDAAPPVLEAIPRTAGTLGQPAEVFEGRAEAAEAGVPRHAGGEASAVLPEAPESRGRRWEEEGVPKEADHRRGAEAPGEAPGPGPAEAEEEICRYCFGGREDGPLISPCRCTGGQRLVHLSCLRKWQRTVVAGQSTHPAFWEDDIRHYQCNVCLAEFTCAPPSRHELMESFTGPELAALLEEGCVIGARRCFSEELEQRLQGMPPAARHEADYGHWIRGAYLITSVQREALTSLSMSLANQGELDAFREHLDGALCLTVSEQRFRITAAGSLLGAERGGLADALAALRAPAELVMASEIAADAGQDHICAVNLSQPLERSPQPAVSARDIDKALSEHRALGGAPANVEIRHYHGGPCDDDEIAHCIVLGGLDDGWMTVRRLQDAVQLAMQLAAKCCDAQQAPADAQPVEIVGVPGEPHLNGRLGVAVRFVESSGHWLVRLNNDESCLVRPEHLKALQDSPCKVLAFWGDAQWSRTQLLGEIARGHWGLCRAGLADLLAPASECWHLLQGRLSFAPVTEMTEDFLLQAGQHGNSQDQG